MAHLRVACLAGLISLVAGLNARGIQKPIKHDHDLAFMHVPYNFGHTVEFTRMFPTPTLNAIFAGHRNGIHARDDSLNISWLSPTLVGAAHALKPDYERWGHLNKKLLETSPVTGCGLYFTPQKYWPEDLAKTYFGNKTVFGLLRDPYERLIAMFRGDLKGYGASKSKFVETCDVNGAIKEMMNQVIENNDPFVSACTFLPQAEYFDGPYGITLPVDNRLFPQSMNKVFKEHGYSERINNQNIFHVKGCNNVWAGNLTAETKQLVKKVYARDFELLCKHFGYCNDEENTCITGVYHMCPNNLFEWNDKTNHYILRN